MDWIDVVAIIGIPAILFGVPVLILVANDALRRRQRGGSRHRTDWQFMGPALGAVCLAVMVYGVASIGYGPEAAEVVHAALYVVVIMTSVVVYRRWGSDVPRAALVRLVIGSVFSLPVAVAIAALLVPVVAAPLDLPGWLTGTVLVGLVVIVVLLVSLEKPGRTELR